MPAGQPTKYTQEIADKVCALLSEGQSMRTVCKDKEVPASRTLFRWLRTNEEFCQQYTRAKQESADALTDEMLDICDDGSNDWMESNAKGDKGYEFNGEHLQRSRLRVETRKWLSSKLKPKKYGERQHLEHSGEIGLPGLTDAELKAKLIALQTNDSE